MGFWLVLPRSGGAFCLRTLWSSPRRSSIPSGVSAFAQVHEGDDCWAPYFCCAAAKQRRPGRN
eukprot:5111865-Pyramimonas_sp.AAC.1